jgi:CMP-N,N'-diacetyllegionaminic acid synthase
MTMLIGVPYKSVLAIIPARAGSKRIRHKNIRHFAGRPLIAHTIEQARSSDVIDRVIVDTDSPELAAVARKYGAEVPFLRPAHLADDHSPVIDSVFHLLGRLNKEENYTPSHILILQTTSPLREVEDIEKCWHLMQSSKATTLVTVCATRPKPKDLAWLVGDKVTPTHLAANPKKVLYGYNGFVFLVETKALLKEKQIITKKTAGVVCSEWRSIDIDVPEEWALAELLFKHKAQFVARLKAVAKR